MARGQGSTGVLGVQQRGISEVEGREVSSEGEEAGGDEGEGAVQRSAVREALLERLQQWKRVIQFESLTAIQFGY